MNQLKINIANGEAFGNLTLGTDNSGPGDIAAAYTLTDGTTTGSLTLETGTALTSLCGTIADSTASDVAGIVADFNALLAALKLANIIS